MNQKRISVNKYQVMRSWVFMMALLFSGAVKAQEDKKEVRAGNSSYEQGQYSEAEIEYRKAIEKNATSYAGTYNLGSSLYRQDKTDEAVSQYTAAAERANNPLDKAAAYHNLGNALVKAERYEEAVNAYKNALKLNPGDNDTRYNLAYAQARLKQQQQQQQQNDKGDQENKDQENKKQDEQAKESGADDKQQEQSKDGSPAQKQPKISKEDAERILQALKNNEQDLNRKLSRKEGVRINVEKNW